MSKPSQAKNKQRLLSHGETYETLKQTIERIKARIHHQEKQPDVTVEEQLRIVDELASFPFGQFLLQNRGWDGYWTDYTIKHPYNGRISGKDSQGRPLTELEKMLLDKFPAVIATQQRAVHFQKVIQQYITSGAILASVPCGLMRDLLGRDFTGVENFRLVGIDLDPKSLEGAKQLAEQYGLSSSVEFYQEDAWNLPFQERFTLLTSNGLNIYEPDDEKVTHLYKQFFKSLVPGGILVTSFLTPPPQSDPNSEWQMNQIDPDALQKQKIVFHDVLNVKFQCYRNASTIQLQLQNAGFDEMEFIWDDACIFPTVVAHKPR
ncbi:MAG: class I SAM-dependent methyltransferase [Xenococcaceae cyanobacterium]